MKKLLVPLFLLTILLGCNEEENISNIVKYEVIIASGDIWLGAYISETGETVCFCEPPWPQNGWTYTFEVTEKPFTLHIDATTECGNCDLNTRPDATTNIYVDNVLVATNTSNWAPGLASADYVIE